jgi:hypothetical protein
VCFAGWTVSGVDHVGAGLERPGSTDDRKDASVSQYLERSDEVTGEMSGRSAAEAALWFAYWLQRRDLLH